MSKRPKVSPLIAERTRVPAREGQRPVQGVGEEAGEAGDDGAAAQCKGFNGRARRRRLWCPGLGSLLWLPI